MSTLSNEQISSRGFWLTEDSRNHCYDSPLADKLKELFNLSDVLELVLEWLKDKDINSAIQFA